MRNLPLASPRRSSWSPHSPPGRALSRWLFPPISAPKIDAVFARFTDKTPGCAVGLGKDGRALYTHGYGMANLEYNVPITESTVLESGSVAKQFTASAIVLLAQDGKLSLDDDIRKYLPGGARLRRPEDHDPQPADAHERPARPVGPARHRGTRAGYTGPLAGDDARPRRPSEDAQFPAGIGVSLQQHRIRARRDHRAAGEWQDARRVHAGAPLPPARHDAHALA